MPTAESGSQKNGHVLRTSTWREYQVQMSETFTASQPKSQLAHLFLTFSPGVRDQNGDEFMRPAIFDPEIWEPVKCRGKEELLRFNAQLANSLSNDLDLPDPIPFILGLVIGKYDIWAKTTIELIANKYQYDKCQSLLKKEASSWLLAAYKWPYSYRYVDFQIEELRNKLTLDLRNRVSHWEAEALAHINRSAAVSQGPAKSDLAPSVAPRPRRGPKSRNAALYRLIADLYPLSHLQTCQHLDARKARAPRSARWAELTWTAAYLDETYGPLVRKFLSTARRKAVR